MALFHEHTSALGLLGAGLVVAGVVAVSADKQHQHPPKAGAVVQLGSKPAHGTEVAGAELNPRANGLTESQAAWQMAADATDEEEAAAAAAAGERGPLLPPRR